MDKDITGDGRVDYQDLEWQYLEGDGDFRSREVCSLRDEADIIVTNPPFSLFREFLEWIVSAGKQFLIIGNMNAISYKEVFPLIKYNKIWFGESIHSGDREFGVPDEYPLTASGWRIGDDGKKYIRVKGVRWFTNLELYACPLTKARDGGAHIVGSVVHKTRPQVVFHPYRSN